MSEPVGKVKIECEDSLSMTVLAQLRLKMQRAETQGYSGNIELVFPKAHSGMFDDIVDTINRAGVVDEVRREIIELAKIIKEAKGDE